MRKSSRIVQLAEKKKEEEAKKEEEQAKLKAKVTQAKKVKAEQRKRAPTKAQKAQTASKNRKRPGPSQGSGKLQMPSKKQKQAPTSSTQTSQDDGAEEDDPMTAAEMIRLHRQFGSLIVDTLEKLPREEILEAIAQGGYVKREEEEEEEVAGAHGNVEIREGADIDMEFLLRQVKTENPDEEQEAGTIRDGEDEQVVKSVVGGGGAEEHSERIESEEPCDDVAAPKSSPAASADVSTTPDVFGPEAAEADAESRSSDDVVAPEAIPDASNGVSATPDVPAPDTACLPVCRRLTSASNMIDLLDRGRVTESAPVTLVSFSGVGSGGEEASKSQNLIGEGVKDHEGGASAKISEKDDGEDARVGEVLEAVNVIKELMEEMVDEVVEKHDHSTEVRKKSLPMTNLKEARVFGPLGSGGWSVDTFEVMNFPMEKKQGPRMGALLKILEGLGIRASDDQLKMNDAATGMYMKATRFRVGFQAREPVLQALHELFNDKTLASRMETLNRALFGQERDKYVVFTMNLDKIGAVVATLYHEVAKLLVKEGVKAYSTGRFLSICPENEVPTVLRIRHLVEGRFRQYFDAATKQFTRNGRNVLDSVLHNLSKFD